MGEEQPNAEEKPIVSDEPFTLKIPDYGRNLSFDGPSDFKEWVDKEHEAWKEITGVNQVVRLGGDQAVENHRKFFMRLASNADIWVNSTEEPASRNALAVVIQMTPALLRGEYLLLTGRRGKRFLAAIEEDPVTAVGILLWNWSKQEEIRNSRSEPQLSIILARAMTEARVRELTGKGLPDAINRQLQGLAEDWDARAKTHVGTIAGVEAETNGIRDKAAAEFAAIGEMRENHEAEMGRIRKNYDELMRLKGPTKYWRDKKWAHLWVSTVAFAIFAFAVAGGIYAVWKYGAGVLDMLPKAEDGTIGLGSIALVTLPALAFFWLLRLISRVFVTNLHHMTDAGLRATMVTTFHALMTDETNPVSADERLLVLQALFRPVGEGPDDAAPTNLMENLIKGRASRDT